MRDGHPQAGTLATLARVSRAAAIIIGIIRPRVAGLSALGRDSPRLG